jgi:hypothetical protein
VHGGQRLVLRLRRLISKLLADNDPADQLGELAHYFAQPTPAALLGFRLFVSAFAAREEAKEEFAVEPWAHLLNQLGTPPDTHLGLMQGLLEILLGVCYDPVAAAALGRAARTLYTRVSKDDCLSGWLCKSVVGNVVRTFTPARLALVAFLEIPALAKHLLDFVESGPELVVQLYHCAFQHQLFTLEGPAPLLRSYILSMSMNP